MIDQWIKNSFRWKYADIIPLLCQHDVGYPQYLPHLLVTTAKLMTCSLAEWYGLPAQLRSMQGWFNMGLLYMGFWAIGYVLTITAIIYWVQSDRMAHSLRYGVILCLNTVWPGDLKLCLHAKLTLTSEGQSWTTLNGPQPPACCRPRHLARPAVGLPHDLILMGLSKNRRDDGSTGQPDSWRRDR